MTPLAPAALVGLVLAVGSAVVPRAAAQSPPGEPARAAPSDPSEPDPRAIIRAADAALAAVRTLAFDAESRPTGAVSTLDPLVNGRVVLAEFNLAQPARWRFVAKGRASWPDSTRSGDFHTLTSDDGVISIRPSAKEIVEAPVADADALLDDGGRWLAGWLAAWPSTVARPILEPGPVKATWEGRRPIDGVSCDVIRIDAGAIDEVETDSWWFIAESDHLPRRIDRLVLTPHGPGITTLELRNLRVNQPFDPEEFKFGIPLGYRIITDYTPPPVPPRFAARGRAPIAQGAIAPDFDLASSRGERRRLSDLRGRAVLLAFFASWSRPSTALLADLKPLLDSLTQQEVTVWALSAFDPGDPAAAVRDAGLKIDVLLDADPVARRFGITEIPALVVLGPDGRTLLVRPGGAKDDIDAAKAAILSALKK
ncbi:MAG: redoxin domain-containing protein [Phycisphaerae bacterium]|nr:redoxin domain-containing protein [Phycisphaerae bacterium]